MLMIQRFARGWPICDGGVFGYGNLKKTQHHTQLICELTSHHARAALTANQSTRKHGATSSSITPG